MKRKNLKPIKEKQIGVLGWMQTPNGVRLMIITSRRTGRWVLPKGTVDANHTVAQAVAAEAFEEAGIRGDVAALPIGCYKSLKIRKNRRYFVGVELYPLCIREVLDGWPESNQRKRKLVDIETARTLLSQSEMTEMATALIEQVTRAASDEQGDQQLRVGAC